MLWEGVSPHDYDRNIGKHATCKDGQGTASFPPRQTNGNFHHQNIKVLSSQEDSSTSRRGVSHKDAIRRKTKRVSQLLAAKQSELGADNPMCVIAELVNMCRELRPIVNDVSTNDEADELLNVFKDTNYVVDMLIKTCQKECQKNRTLLQNMSSHGRVPQRPTTHSIFGNAMSKEDNPKKEEMNDSVKEAGFEKAEREKMQVRNNSKWQTGLRKKSTHSPKIIIHSNRRIKPLCAAVKKMELRKQEEKNKNTQVESRTSVLEKLSISSSMFKRAFNFHNFIKINQLPLRGPTAQSSSIEKTSKNLLPDKSTSSSKTHCSPGKEKSRMEEKSIVDHQEDPKHQMPKYRTRIKSAGPKTAKSFMQEMKPPFEQSSLAKMTESPFEVVGTPAADISFDSWFNRVIQRDESTRPISIEKSVTKVSHFRSNEDRLEIITPEYSSEQMKIHRLSLSDCGVSLFNDASLKNPYNINEEFQWPRRLQTMEHLPSQARMFSNSSSDTFFNHYSHEDDFLNYYGSGLYELPCSNPESFLQQYEGYYAKALEKDFEEYLEATQNFPLNAVQLDHENLSNNWELKRPPSGQSLQLQNDSSEFPNACVVRARAATKSKSKNSYPGSQDSSVYESKYRPFSSHNGRP